MSNNRPKTWMINVDSSNSITTKTDDDKNNTNDVRVSLSSKIGNLPVTSIEMMTLEIQSTQYMIETSWNTLSWCTGIYETMGSGTNGFRLTGDVDGKAYTFDVYLPYRLNKFEITSGTSVTTSYNHNLAEIDQLWNWGQPIRFINNIDDIVLTNPNTGAFNSMFPTNQSISNSSWSLTSVSGTAGYVYVPPIPTFGHLATILETLINNKITSVLPLIQNAFQFNYDVKTGKFQWSCSDVISDARLDLSSSYVSRRLGFTSVLPGIAAQFPSHSVDSIHIPEGDYSTAADVIQAIQFQLNRFVLTSGTTYTFQINLPDELETHSITMGMIGRFTAETLCQYLTALMSAANVQITFNTNQFLFARSGGQTTVFELDFSGSNVAQILGFQTIIYAGKTSYRSDETNIYAGSTYDLRCASTGRPNQVQFSAHAGVLHTDLKQFETAVGAAQIRIKTLTTVHHGFQTNDIVRINGDPNIPANKLIVITSTTSTGTVNTFHASLYGIPWITNNGDTFGKMHRFEIPTINLLNTHNSRLSHLLGFRAHDLIWSQSNKSDHILALNDVNVAPEPYIIVQMLYPDQSLTPYDHHYNQEPPLPYVLGKVTLIKPTNNFYNKPYTTKIFMTSVHRLAQLHVRFLNPDGSLYQLHGRPWSMTLKVSLYDKLHY